jgi:hypothetical protein
MPMTPATELGGVPFEARIERARTILVVHIARHGTFGVTRLGGILVCHR